MAILSACRLGNPERLIQAMILPWPEGVEYNLQGRKNWVLFDSDKNSVGKRVGIMTDSWPPAKGFSLLANTRRKLAELRCFRTKETQV